jgi:formylglycine-generating enzyme required for sulfatase activity
MTILLRVLRVLRVLRGGSWFNDARLVRCAVRSAAAPGYRRPRLPPPPRRVLRLPPGSRGEGESR